MAVDGFVGLLGVDGGYELGEVDAVLVFGGVAGFVDVGDDELVGLGEGSGEVGEEGFGS